MIHERFSIGEGTMARSVDPILIIGFDGLDYEVFTRYNTLFTCLPCYSPVPLTGPAWTSIYTGWSIERHEVRDGWGRRRPWRYSPNPLVNELKWHIHELLASLGAQRLTRFPRYRTYRNTKATHFWDRLAVAHFNVKLYNIPITWPLRKVNGIHIGGFPCPANAPYAFPPSAASKLPDGYRKKSDIIHWFVDPFVSGMGAWRKPLENKGFSEALEETRADSLELAENFISFGRYDCQMIQFSFIDRLGHVFGVLPEGTEARIYMLVKELIESLIASADCEKVLLISDHGFMNYDHTQWAVMGFRGFDLPQILLEGFTANVKDFAPTLLGLFGIQADVYSGRDILQIKSDDDQIGKTATQKEEMEYRQLRQRLEDLGYF